MALLAPAAQALENLTLQLNGEHQFEYSGYYAAQLMGYFKEAGLSVEFREGLPGTEVENNVLIGDAQYGVSDSHILLNRYQGKPVVSLAAILQHSPLCLAVAENRGINTVHDLVGRTIMLDPHATDILAYLRAEGLSQDKLTIIPSTMSWVDVANGKADGMAVLIGGDVNDLTRAGVKFKIFRPTSSGIDFYGQLLFTTDKRVQDHPHQVAAFRAAAIKGWHYALANPEKMVEWILKTYPGKDTRDDLDWEASQIKKLVDADLIDVGYQSPGRWQHIADTLADLGRLPRDFAVKDLIYVPPLSLQKLDLKPYYVPIAIGLTVFSLIMLVTLYFFWINRRLRRSERLYRELSQNAQSVLDAVDDGIIGINSEGHAIFANPTALRMLGYDEVELLGQDLHDLIHRSAIGEQIDSSQCKILKALAADSEVMKGEDFYAHRDGHIIIVEYALSIINKGTSGRRGVIAFRDITARKEDDIRMQEAASVFDNSSNAIFIADASNRIRQINPAFTMITGYTADEVIGKNPNILKSGRHDAAFYTAMWNQLVEQGRWSGEMWNRHKDGAVFLEWLTITAIRGSKGGIKAFIAQFNEMTSRKLAEENMRLRCNYDPLTGLSNRNLLTERLIVTLRESQRYKRLLALLTIDLDCLPHVNENFGYLAGDKLLQEAAKRLQASIRETDMLARQSGDVFIVAVQGLTHGEAAASVADKIIQALTPPFQIGGQRIETRTCIGIAIHPDDGDEVATLFTNAANALARAREKEHRNFQFYDEAMNASALERQFLGDALQRAIEQQQLEVYYQPVLDLETQQIVSAEALLRWRLPERGRIAPDVFFPLAEQFGLLGALGDWVIESVCQQMAVWQRQGWEGYVTINLSGPQIPLLTPTRLEWFLAEHGLAPRHIGLEVSEGDLLPDIAQSQRWLDEIRGMGIKVSLDDFATGHGALKYFKQLHLDRLKVNKSFVLNLSRSPADQALIKAALAIAERLLMTVTAVGVENGETLALLKSLGCHYAQGYHLSPPVPAQNFQVLIQKELRD